MSTIANPNTIVLVHGFWVTPRSWEHWIPHYEAKGYRVLAPAYPGFEVEVEALNADPTPVERLTVPAIIAHLESIVGALDAPPILMGHSAGGTFVQMLLDHGFGAAGVTFNSAPTEGVLDDPPSRGVAVGEGVLDDRRTDVVRVADPEAAVSVEEDLLLLPHDQRLADAVGEDRRGEEFALLLRVHLEEAGELRVGREVGRERRGTGGRHREPPPSLAAAATRRLGQRPSG